MKKLSLFLALLFISVNAFADYSVCFRNDTTGAMMCKSTTNEKALETANAFDASASVRVSIQPRPEDEEGVPTISKMRHMLNQTVGFIRLVQRVPRWNAAADRPSVDELAQIDPDLFGGEVAETGSW